MEDLPRLVVARRSSAALVALALCSAGALALLLALADAHARMTPLLLVLIVATLLAAGAAGRRLLVGQQLVLDPRGLRDCASGQFTGWQEISRIRLVDSETNQPRVILELSESSRPERIVSLVHVRPDPSWALKNMLLYWRRYHEEGP